MDSNNFRSVKGCGFDNLGSGRLSCGLDHKPIGFCSSLFLYMKCLEERIKFGRINPFKLANVKFIDGVCGTVNQVKPLRDGQLLI